MSRKERYFTAEGIDAKCAAFLADPDVERREGAASFAPGKSALLLLDLQRYFLEEDSHAFVPSAPAILPRLRELAVAYEERGLPVIRTRHANDEKNAGRMADWWRDRIGPNDPRGALAEEAGAGGRIVVKNRYDAFLGTDLEEDLRRRGVEQVVVCGVLAHLCCESTARSAFMRDFSVFLAVDGIADYHEAFHRASLLSLAHGFAVPVLVKDLLAGMGASDAD